MGDVIRLYASGVALGDMAEVENTDGETSLARVIGLDRNLVSLQVFAGGKGLSTDAAVQFLGRPLDVVYSANILGRIFRGSGEPMDGGPDLSTDPRVPVGGPTVNPVMRVMPTKMIETRVPMIDLFNCLVESQKIPIFSVAGEPHNELLARIGFQADAEVLVFGGLGLIFDDYHFFRTAFEEHGVFGRTVMFVNQASDPLVERLLVPDMALAVAEKFAVEREQAGPGADDRHDRLRRRHEGDRRGAGTHPGRAGLHGRPVHATRRSGTRRRATSRARARSRSSR